MNAPTSIGLIVQVQLATRSKLFSPAPTSGCATPNSGLCAFDLGLPGTLPRLNGHAVALAVRAALALGCELQPQSRFVRRHESRPDLPKGYLLTQRGEPLARGGSVPFGDGLRCRLQRLYLEEDRGTLHSTPTATLVDLNRAGMPLLGIVSEPDLPGPAHASAFLRELLTILRTAAVSAADDVGGALRCAATISVPAPDAATADHTVHLMHLGSPAMLQQALEHEQRRQIALRAAGVAVTAETRVYDAIGGETRPRRDGPAPADPRYLPDPDLPPLRIEDHMLTAEREWLATQPPRRGADEREW
ncbi:MAG: hypothetical protein K8J09_08500 [Planctomycetes bacterium]|nr:hypothetical protein [Planctomycetota bacterium]MCC7396135.1 hypothetical protein [Planctomycetota bacterium]